VIVEEEDPDLPTMKIQNRSNIAIVYQQVGNQQQREIDIVDADSSQAFSWTDHQGLHQLKIEFYNRRKYDEQADLLCPVIDGQTLQSINVSLDELNLPQQEITFSNKQSIFYTVTTNGYTKILKFSQRSISHNDTTLVLVPEPEIKVELIIP
jgi:hypothetical protein